METYFQNQAGEFKNLKSVFFGDVTFVFDPRRQLTDAMMREAMQVRAKDTLDMWDVNGDGFASRAEVNDVIAYFHYYRWRQELVDSAVTVKTSDGEEIHLPIGSALFKQRLEIVEKITKTIRSSPPPNLDSAAYPRISPKDEL